MQGHIWDASSSSYYSCLLHLAWTLKPKLLEADNAKLSVSSRTHCECGIFFFFWLLWLRDIAFHNSREEKKQGRNWEEGKQASFTFRSTQKMTCSLRDKNKALMKFLTLKAKRLEIFVVLLLLCSWGKVYEYWSLFPLFFILLPLLVSRMAF